MLGSFFAAKEDKSPSELHPHVILLFEQSYLNYECGLVFCSSTRVKVGNQVDSLDATTDGGYGKWSTVSAVVSSFGTSG